MGWGSLPGPYCIQPASLYPHSGVQDLQQAVSKLEARLSALEKSSPLHRATTPQTQVRAYPHQGPRPGAEWGPSGRPQAAVRAGAWGPACVVSASGTGPLPRHASPMRSSEPPSRKAATAARRTEDDDIDLFGSFTMRRTKEAARSWRRGCGSTQKEGQEACPGVPSLILLDVKPVSGSPPTFPSPPHAWGPGGVSDGAVWASVNSACGLLSSHLSGDDETDMAQLEACGCAPSSWTGWSGELQAGTMGCMASASCRSSVVEDDKVGTDQLEEEITKFEEHVSEGALGVQGCPMGTPGQACDLGNKAPCDHQPPSLQVQSVDIAAFNKI